MTTLGTNPWDPQATNTFAAEAGDYVASVWVDGPSGADVNFVVQLPVDPWTRLGELETTLDATEGEFQEITFNFTVESAVDIQAALHGGYEGNVDAVIYWDGVVIAPVVAE